MKKLGICLGAGGARGIAHVGFLQALIENDISINVVTGCSMGSLVGALFLSGYTPFKMREMALDLKKNDIIDITVGMAKNKAFLKSQKFDSILNELFGDTTIESLSKPFACIATDIISGDVYTFNKGLIQTAVRASCSIPLFFKPIELENMLLVDGGIRNRTPVGEARELGAEVVVAVDVLFELPKAEKLDNIIDVGLRTFDILSCNINMFSSQKQRPELLLIPDLGNVSQFKIDNQDFCFDRGYEMGYKNIEKIKELVSH